MRSSLTRTVIYGPSFLLLIDGRAAGFDTSAGLMYSHIMLKLLHILCSGYTQVNYSVVSEPMQAVDELKFLLKISENKVAKLAGISRSIIRNWRKGQGAYSNTTSKLFQILHLIYALNSVMKQEQMLAWLNEPDNKNPSFTRLDILAQPDGPASVSQQASHFLFPPPPSSLPSPDELRKELELIDLEEQTWMEPGESPRQYSARPRRQRPDREFE